MPGKLIIISGPSGAGKGSILTELINKDGYSFSVSMTTRAPRLGEVDGVNYYFVSQEEFDKTIHEDGFLEYVHKFERSYGTPKKQILEKIASGTNIILDIEMEGALNVKRLYPDAILLFVLPPNLKILHERLLGRGSESVEQIKNREKDIQKEIAEIVNYDYYVVNDEINAAVERVERIVSGEGEEYRIIDPQAIIDKYKEE